MAKNDLGSGNVLKLLIKLAVPAVLAQLINALYNIVDRIYIGKGVGDLALTAVGVTFPITMLIAAFSAFVGMGGAPRVAIKMGEGKNEEASGILSNCFVVLLIISGALTVLFLSFGRQLLMLFGASENTIDLAFDYMFIYVIGTVFVQVSLGLNSFITTQGYATTSMLTVLIGAVLNIVLDPIFIFTFGLGVKGAALATIISQGVSAIWVLSFLFSKKSKIKIQKRYFKLKKDIILPVFALGVSPFIMQSTESLLNIVVNSSLQRYGGDIAVGAMTILNSVMQFCMMPVFGVAQGAQPIIGFNYGAGKIDRVKKACRYLITINVVYTTVVWAISIFFPQLPVSIFANKQALFDKAVWALPIFMAGSLLLGLQYACQQSFVALGQAKISLCLALLRKIILLIPLTLILPLFFSDKVFAVFLAEPIADVAASLTTSLVFLFSIKKILSQRETKEPEKEC